MGIEVGSPCCDCAEDAGDRLGTAGHNVFCGQSWPIGADSRWTHLTDTLRRIVVGEVANRILPTSLSNLQIAMDAGDSMCALLANAIKADKEDWNSRNRLRLLRLCQQVCPLRAGAVFSIFLSIVIAGDHLLFAILGPGKKGRARTTIRELADPETSAIVEALAHVCKLSENWGVGEAGWALVILMNVPLDDLGLRQEARMVSIQQSCGLTD